MPASTIGYDISADYVDSTTAYDPRPGLDALSDTGSLMANVVTTGQSIISCQLPLTRMCIGETNLKIVSQALTQPMVVGVVVVEEVEGRKPPPRPSHYHQSRDRLNALRKPTRPPVYPEALRLVRFQKLETYRRIVGIRTDCLRIVAVFYHTQLCNSV